MKVDAYLTSVLLGQNDKFIFLFKRGLALVSERLNFYLLVERKDGTDEKTDD